MALASPLLGKLKPKRLFVGAPENSPESSSSDLGILQGAMDDQSQVVDMRLSPDKARPREPAAPWSGPGLPYLLIPWLPSQGSNVTTNNLDFNQEIAHPLLCPTYRPAEEKDTMKPRLCTGANRAGPAPQPVCLPVYPITTKWSGRIPSDTQSPTEKPW